MLFSTLKTAIVLIKLHEIRQKIADFKFFSE
jgi:hypothetical protein